MGCFTRKDIGKKNSVSESLPCLDTLPIGRYDIGMKILCQSLSCIDTLPIGRYDMHGKL